MSSRRWRRKKQKKKKEWQLHGKRTNWKQRKCAESKRFEKFIMSWTNSQYFHFQVKFICTFTRHPIHKYTINVNFFYWNKLIVIFLKMNKYQQKHEGKEEALVERKLFQQFIIIHLLLHQTNILFITLARMSSERNGEMLIFLRSYWNRSHWTDLIEFHSLISASASDPTTPAKPKFAIP